jgi:hypothetical protein
LGATVGLATTPTRRGTRFIPLREAKCGEQDIGSAPHAEEWLALADGKRPLTEVAILGLRIDARSHRPRRAGPGKDLQI